MVDTIFADIPRPDQACIVVRNAHNFLKTGGHFVITMKVSILILKQICLLFGRSKQSENLSCKITILKSTLTKRLF